MKTVAILPRLASLMFILAFSLAPTISRSELASFDVRTGHWYLSPVSVVGSWLECWLSAQLSTFLGRPGYLATIKDATENELVRYVTDFYFYTEFQFAKWIGGFETHHLTQRWEWITGEPFAYTNWSPLEPNNNGGREDFLEMLGGEGGRWNDIAFDYFGSLQGKRGFAVVEYEPSQVKVVSLTGPTTINSPKTVNFTVTLDAPAPRGGVVLFLHSNISSIASVLPGSVSIASGNLSNVVQINVSQVGATQTGVVRVYGKNKKTLNVTVNP
jgi:hypothetical protein